MSLDRSSTIRIAQISSGGTDNATIVHASTLFVFAVGTNWGVAT